MPQIFQVLRCYQCQVFQVHQTKKSNKFQCKLCGEKQSMKRHYGIGTAKDCRLHVQRLNGIRGEIDDLKENISSSASDEENELSNVKTQSKPRTPSGKSKWSNYDEQNEEENSKLVPEAETMYLNNTEVVLEVTKKRKKANFKCPSLKTTSDSIESSHYEESVPMKIVKSETRQDGVSYNDTNFDKLGSKVVFNEDCANDEVKPEVKQSVNPMINIMKEVRKHVTPTVNTNSKWAQYVEEEQEKDDTKEFQSVQANNETLVGTRDSQNYEDVHLDGPHKNSQELFALCDESDLDDVLDI